MIALAANRPLLADCAANESAARPDAGRLSRRARRSFPPRSPRTGNRDRSPRRRASGSSSPTTAGCRGRRLQLVETNGVDADGKLSLGKQIASTAVGCTGTLQGQDGGSPASSGEAGLDTRRRQARSQHRAVRRSRCRPGVRRARPRLDSTKWKLTAVSPGRARRTRPASRRLADSERRACYRFDRLQRLPGHGRAATGKLTFGELATTRRACAGEAAALESLA